MSELPKSWWTIAGLVGFVISFEVTRRYFGLPTVLLVSAGVLLVVVVMVMWQSLQALSGDDSMSLEEALTLAAPAAEEEQKVALLRALKDLEFERRVGKVSEEDFSALSTRYRSEARALLLRLDTRYEPVRQRIAAEVEALVREADDGPGDSAECVGSPEPTGEAVDLGPVPAPRRKVSRKRARSAGDTPKRQVPTRACKGCGARNRLDRVQCRKCGKPLAPAGERPCSACPACYVATLPACPNCGVRAGDS